MVFARQQRKIMVQRALGIIGFLPRIFPSPAYFLNGPAWVLFSWCSLREMTPAGGYGEQRWYFVCPEMRLRLSKLYLPNGGAQFLSQQAYGMEYRSQRVGWIGHMRARPGSTAS
jgi:hypothetical protein